MSPGRIDIFPASRDVGTHTAETKEGSSMLGEKIGEERGKVTSRRVLKSGDPHYLKMEITFETQATVYGVSCMSIGTYEVFERISGQLYGVGQGMIRTPDGEGAIWNGHGVGVPTPDGGVKFAASVAYQAGSQGKLARLNHVLVLVEHTSSGDGSVRSTFSEWKA
jgi:hypothetical protein